jgi:hypothetical protein
MILLLQFLAVLSTLFFLYFYVFRDKEPRRGKLLRPVVVQRPSARRSVTRSEWKKRLY